MKKILSFCILSLFFILSNLYADSKLCINMSSKVSTSPKTISLYKNIIFNNLVSNKYVKNQIKLSKLFAKAYLKKYTIDKTTKNIIKLQTLRILSLLYIDKLKKLHTPSEKVLKSYYFDHIDEFNPIEKVSLWVLTKKSLKRADELYLKIKKDHKLFLNFLNKQDNSITNSYKSYYKDESLLTFTPQVREWIREHKVGDISEPVKVGSFFLICKLIKKEKPNKTYKALKEGIEKRLLAMYMRKLVKDEYKRLTQESEK